MYFIINEHELSAMNGMPYFYQQVYLRLRQAMDYQTGWVGQGDYWLSYSSLQKLLWIEPRPGICHSGFPTVSKLRTAIDALIRRGLVEKATHPEEFRLVFLLPKATLSSFFTQNKVSRKLSRQSCVVNLARQKKGKCTVKSMVFIDVNLHKLAPHLALVIHRRGSNISKISINKKYYRALRQADPLTRCST
jgi:hypothetical protein